MSTKKMDAAIERIESSESSSATIISRTTHITTTNSSSISSSSTTASANNKITSEAATTVQKKSSATTTTTNGEKAIKKKSETNGKKKSKKSRKSDPEKENISVKSSFSKFDALQKKNILHVRSSDAGKAQKKFNGSDGETTENTCRSCAKAVYKMEEVKAERNIWHKTCFKCSECSKQLNVDTYQSHESVLYCKPHFKALFSPKVVEEQDSVLPRKAELIIRENQPIELPPDVVRSCDKADLGLEELHQLNVKSRYQVFENTQAELEREVADRSPGVVKRSASILSKLAKFQTKETDTVDSLNGAEDTTSENSEDEDDENAEDIDLIRAKRAQRERPLSFANMNDIKSRFESGHAVTKEERREERKQEIQNIRSRLFMGKQAKIKEMYQQAVLDSEQGIRSVDKKPEVDIGDKARSIKDRFEKGEVFNKTDETDGNTHNSYHRTQDEDMVFEQGIGKQSRSLFMEMDANAAKSPAAQGSTPVTPTPKTPENRRNTQVSPVWPPQKKKTTTDDVVKCDEKLDDCKIETADISNKFKFFETYKPDAGEKKAFRITPPREGVVRAKSPDQPTEVYSDPDMVRGGAGEFDSAAVAVKSSTTTKMLSMFRQMEEKKHDAQQYDGLKPLKRFTPPPDDGRRVRNSESDNDCTDDSEDDDNEDDDDEEDSEHDDGDQQPANGDYVRSSDKNVDEFLLQAQSAARAKQLRAKFERWETKEIMREQNASSVLLYDGNDQSQVETAKEIRAKFESMRDTPSHAEHRERIKVNRFV